MRTKFGDGKLTLLHIDDSADDRFLVMEAITLAKTPFTYHERRPREVLRGPGARTLWAGLESPRTGMPEAEVVQVSP